MTVLTHNNLIAMAKKVTNANQNPNSEAVSNSSPQNSIENKIMTIRNVQVILDEDIAREYGVTTGRLNEQVKRNIERFPHDFMFQLTREEFLILKSHFATSSWGGRRKLPFAFTELGVSMLSSVLTSKRAIEANIMIMRAFAAMRRFLVANSQVFQRLDRIEYKLLESDQKIEDLYSKLEQKKLDPQQGAFYDGQIYDAYEFICNLLKKANTRIVLIDNYIDDSVLTMLDKRTKGVNATLFTQQISNQFKLDLEKHNQQYPPIDVMLFKKAHDRFLIIDDEVYLVGASLKDLGKKWFAVALLSTVTPNEMLSRLITEAVNI